MEHDQPPGYLVDLPDDEIMQRRLKLLEGLSRGERAVRERKTCTHAEARERMSKWLK